MLVCEKEAFLVCNIEKRPIFALSFPGSRQIEGSRLSAAFFSMFFIANSKKVITFVHY